MYWTADTGLRESTNFAWTKLPEAAEFHLTCLYKCSFPRVLLLCLARYNPDTQSLEKIDIFTKRFYV